MKATKIGWCTYQSECQIPFLEISHSIINRVKCGPTEYKQSQTIARLYASVHGGEQPLKNEPNHLINSTFWKIEITRSATFESLTQFVKLLMENVNPPVPATV